MFAYREELCLRVKTEVKEALKNIEEGDIIEDAMLNQQQTGEYF